MKYILPVTIVLVFSTVPATAEKDVLNEQNQVVESRLPSKDDFINRLKPSNKVRTRGLALVPGNPIKKKESSTSNIEPVKSEDKARAEFDREAGSSFQQPVTAPQISVNLTFGFNSAQLTDETRATLDNLGQAMQDQQLKPYRFMIEGHTDSVGGTAYNWELSLRRAAAVKRYLIEKHQVAPERMKVVGKGESEPAYPENPQAPSNRRVVIINIGA